MDVFCTLGNSRDTLALMSLIIVVSVSYVLFVVQAPQPATTSPTGGVRRTPPPRVERVTIFAYLMANPRVCTFLASICGVLYFMAINSAQLYCPAVAVAASFRSGTSADTPICNQNRSLPNDLFRPTFPSGSYVLLEGPHGCGKTTAIQWEAQAAGTGVVYVSVPDDTKLFGIEFAAALGLHDSPWWVVSSSFVQGTLVRSHQMFSAMSVFDAVSRTCYVIREIGEQLSQELGRPLVLIIDNSAQLAKIHSDVLYLLQDFAKRGADEGWLRVIISASDGLVPHMLQARSSSSRMVVRQLGDVNSTVAVEYLECRGITEARAAEVVDITGGRFAMLQKGAQWILVGDTLESLKKNLLSAVAAELKVLGLEREPLVEWQDSQKRSKAFWEVAEHIVSHGYVSISQYELLISNLDDRKVLEASNIFMFDKDKDNVTFQSRPVELYMRSALPR